MEFSHFTNQQSKCNRTDCYAEKFNYGWNLCHSLNILIVLISKFIDGDLVCLWCVYFHHYSFFSVSYLKYELAQSFRCFCALFCWRSNLLQMQIIKWAIRFWTDNNHMHSDLWRISVSIKASFKIKKSIGNVWTVEKNCYGFTIFDNVILHYIAQRCLKSMVVSSSDKL